VLERCSGVAGRRLAAGIGQFDAAGDAVGAAFGDFDGRRCEHARQVSFASVGDA
jgi:hypothetical protein